MRQLFTILLTLCVFTTHAQPYKYLVLEGGGIRGIAYAGAIKVLEEQKILDNVECVTGTSVGSIVAGLIAVGYTADEMKTILDDLRLQQFNDGHMIFFGGIHRMKKNYGWYRGEAIEKWMGKLIEAKTGNANLTLNELHTLSLHNKKYKDLYVIATNISKQRQELCSYHTYPFMPVKTAIRASLSIPLYFGAIFIDSIGKAYKKQDKNGTYDVLLDGGVIANYPLTIFDTGSANKHTLGLKLDRPEQIEHNKNASGIAPYNINNFRTYVGALYNLVLEQLNKAGSFEDERKRTIYISTGNIEPRIKKMPKVQKQLLYDNGKQAAEAFLKAH